MARPEFLNCIMTPEIISRIRERQEEYDENPEAYERKEARREEERREEIERENNER